MKAIVRLIVLALSLTLILESTQAGSPRYSITHLRSLYVATSSYAEAKAINDNGVAVGDDAHYDVYDSSGFKALRWDAAGNPTELPLAAGMTEAVALDINNAGAIVGSFSDRHMGYSSGGRRAALWPVQGAATILPSNGGDPSAYFYSHHATTITNTGRIFGKSIFRPVEYAPEAVRLLSSDPNLQGEPIANDNGRVIVEKSGYGMTTYQLEPAFENLGFFVSAEAMNDSGTIVGTSMVQADGTVVPWGLRFAKGFAINDRGDAVGTYEPVNGLYAHAFARVGSVNLDLTDQIVGDSRWQVEFASDINNRGQIVGIARFDHDSNPLTPPVRAAYRLDPIRSPGDTNYDDAVDFDDLLTLAQHYGQSGNGNVFWETGDFNYDWSVDFTDLLTLSQHYAAPASFEADWAIAQSLVPEPTTALFGLVILNGRRRR